MAALMALAYDAGMDSSTGATLDTDRDSVLETVLGAYRMRVEITADVRYCGTWYDQEPATRFGQFHLLTEGECWVSGAALEQPLQLRRGDLIVFPAGVRHVLSSSADPHLPATEDPGDSAMLCGELEFITGTSNPIFTALPAYFVVRADDSSEGFRQLASMLTETSRDRRWGRQLVQNKLADSLFTMAVCEYVRRAERPREDWTIQSMAQCAGMSRTAFAELFSATVGLPPIQYLAQWRATEARRLLKNRRFSVAAVADMLGYRSEAAFRRFFKRIEGIGPGKARSSGDDDAG